MKRLKLFQEFLAGLPLFVQKVKNLLWLAASKSAFVCMSVLSHLHFALATACTAGYRASERAKLSRRNRNPSPLLPLPLDDSHAKGKQFILHYVWTELCSFRTILLKSYRVIRISQLGMTCVVDVNNSREAL